MSEPRTDRDKTKACRACEALESAANTLGNDQQSGAILRHLREAYTKYRAESGNTNGSAPDCSCRSTTDVEQQKSPPQQPPRAEETDEAPQMARPDLPLQDNEIIISDTLMAIAKDFGVDMAKIKDVLTKEKWPANEVIDTETMTHAFSANEMEELCGKAGRTMMVRLEAREDMRSAARARIQVNKQVLKDPWFKQEPALNLPRQAVPPAKRAESTGTSKERQQPPLCRNLSKPRRPHRPSHPKAQHNQEKKKYPGTKQQLSSPSQERTTPK